MEHDGHRERLRARFRKEGMGGFAAHEALELLLTYAIPRVDVNPIAHRLIRRFGSLHAVLEAEPEETCQVEGVGPSAALLLHMMLPLFRMYEQEKLLPRQRLGTYPDVAAYCATLFLGANNEMFYVLCLDAQFQLLATELIAFGAPNAVSVETRQVVRVLMRHNAVGAVITHNHPSGSIRPSQADVDITGEIARVLHSVGIRLHDHVLIAGSRNFSFSRNGLLSPDGETALPGMRAERAADAPLSALGLRGRE